MEGVYTGEELRVCIPVFSKTGTYTHISPFCVLKFAPQMSVSLQTTGGRVGVDAFSASVFSPLDGVVLDRFDGFVRRERGELGMGADVIVCDTSRSGSVPLVLWGWAGANWELLVSFGPVEPRRRGRAICIAILSDGRNVPTTLVEQCRAWSGSTGLVGALVPVVSCRSSRPSGVEVRTFEAACRLSWREEASGLPSVDAPGVCVARSQNAECPSWIVLVRCDRHNHRQVFERHTSQENGRVRSARLKYRIYPICSSNVSNDGPR